MSDDQGYTGPERRQEGLSARAEELSKNVSSLTESVNAQTAYGRRNRHLIRWNILGLVVNLVMVVAVGVLAAVAINASEQAKQATSAAAQNRQDAKLSCLAGNEIRAGQARLWVYVLDASEANPGLTPQQKTLIANFRIYIGEVFVARDCNNPTSVATIPPPPLLPTPTR